MLHFISMFTMYALILDEDKAPFALPILLFSVYLTIFFWTEANKNLFYKDISFSKNVSFSVAVLFFNFYGTILLMGFGILITLPVTVAYSFLLFSIPIYRFSFCGYDSPRKVACLVTPIFMVASLASGYVNWYGNDEKAIFVFGLAYVILSLVVIVKNRMKYLPKPPMEQEIAIKKESFWI